MVPTVTDHISRCDFDFPGEQTISFRKHLSGKMVHIGKTATLTVSPEKGEVHPTDVRMSPEVSERELKSLPKGERPDFESSTFKQWKIAASVDVSVDRSDLVLSLATDISLRHLNEGVVLAMCANSTLATLA